jgi:hypothetical protein
LAIVNQKVSNGPIEAPTDYGFWHVVPASQDSFSDRRQCKIYTLDPQKEKVHFIPLSLQSSKQTHMAPAGKRRFEGKGQAPLGKQLDFAKHHLPRTECGRLRRKGAIPCVSRIGASRFVAPRADTDLVDCRRGVLLQESQP